MAEEPSLIEIYADKNGELYCYIPASSECYKLILDEEEVELGDDFVFITQINLDQLKEKDKIEEAKELGKWIGEQVFDWIDYMVRTEMEKNDDLTDDYYDFAYDEAVRTAYLLLKRREEGKE